ncbi:MAG: pilus assembly protein PilM [Rickettsiales bacterium]|nr:pilus assembly protein PilM [Pseudomonadota bacterium]MDA0966100.1 pilus assembly protein PilM [Pseudomonadota bacterium]MDG4543235.1 pilus assembly protein PilM [Rickettsiales bacterium]MDG4545433.1 pilus assembly protein PilM [Rickettsiales bacterium]MDG4547882.1 pilus assembly protein PilM [Rickettsiales bacterium]
MGLDSLKGKLNKKAGGSGNRASGSGESGLKKLLRGLVGKSSLDKEKILGVDITPHYVRICQLKRTYGKWMLNNLASACMENFFRKADMMVNTDSYAENLKDLVSKNKISSKNVAFTVPSSSSIVKILQFADMSDEDFHQAAKLGAIWESAVNLEGGANEYQIYYKILRHNPAKESSPQPVFAPVNETLAETPMEEPMPQEAPIEIPAENPIEEPMPQEAPIEIPAETPIEEPTPQQEAPMEMPVENPMEEPTPQQEAPTEIPAENPMEEPAPQEAPTEIPAEIPMEEPTPQEVPMETPVETPMEEPAPQEAPIEIPAEAPIEEPVPQQGNPLDNPDETTNNDDDKNTMAEAEGAPAFEETAIISEEIPAEIPTQTATMDVLFIATKTADIDLYANIISKAGLKPVLADVRCLALKHALESYPKIFEEIREPYAFMEFGPDENYVFVVDGERTNIYNVYMSEDDTINLIYSPEDRDKMNIFVQNYANQALQIIQDHQANHHTDAIKHLYVNSSAPIHVHDASTEPTMKVFVREMKKLMTGRTIKECDFCSHIEVPEQFAKKVNAEGNISAWATSVGIAMRKLDVFDVEKHEGVTDINLSNLLPNFEKNKADAITSIASSFAGVILFLLSAAALGFSFISLQNHNKSLIGEIESMGDVDSKYAVTNEELNRVSILVNQVKSLDNIQSSLPSNQPGLIIALKHISQSFPEGLYLNEVTYDLPNEITIKGMSVNDHAILSFVKTLNEKPEIMKVSLKTMETETKENSKNIPGMPNQPSATKNFTLSGNINIKNGQAQVLDITGLKDNGEENGN